MDKIIKMFFSMRMMAIAMIVFLFSIAIATFVESMYDIETARNLIYNSTWFEMLLFFLGMNLISNIFRYKMYQREKIAMLMFHLSFIVMLVGAAITRYVSFEGLMIIKEGQTVDYMYASEPSFWFRINDGVKQYTYGEKTYLSEVSENYFSFDVDFPNHPAPIEIEFESYEKDRVDSIVTNDSINGTAFEIVTNGKKSNFVFEDDFLMIGDVAFSHAKSDAMPGVELVVKNGVPMMNTQLSMRYLPMMEMRKMRETGEAVPDSMYVVVPVDSLIEFKTGTLYNLQSGEQFVFKGLKKNAKLIHVWSGRKNTGTSYLTVSVKDGEKSTLATIAVPANAFSGHELLSFNGLVYDLEYGRKTIQLPFAVKCRDFQLDKYPGSDAPSSFASEVTIIDTERDYTRDQRIFMNNVMDYRGYRFFQSSYEPDESGTHLSVNHDWWGTNISYLGYLMMGIGMLLSLFASAGRFRYLNSLLAKSREKREKMLSVFVLAFLLSGSLFAQDSHEGHNHANGDSPSEKRELNVMTEEHSDKLSTLMVEDIRGRIVPMHTVCDQLLRKISRSNTYTNPKTGEKYNAVQTVISMHMRPDYWMDEPIIYVSKKGGLRDKLGIDGNLVSYKGLLSEEGSFLLLEEYQIAHRTKDSEKGEYEKQLIKLGDKFQVADAIFSWRYMLFIPLEGDENDTWYSPLNLKLLEIDTSGIKKGIRYLAAMDSACADLKSYDDANKYLDVLKAYQYEAGKNVAPPISKIEMEVSYNKMNVFSNSMYSYITIGLIALIIFFIRIFITPTVASEKRFKRISQLTVVLMGLIFLYHGYGMYMRWQITGHAPWSTGYEAVVFIAWVTMLVGLIFSRKNSVVLASTAILAAFMILVTEMNLMDPEITPLQPVLKSYWLMIHVAVITGSYGPLGLSAMLGLLNLILYIFRTKSNAKIMNLNINELTYIAELSMTIGLFMLAIGTFLGGIWANESWGRYWGWDPKETWALVAVLVYAVILHLRYIPALKSKFLFNVLGFWGYASILFTFFGVNFYLSGMHSYANGEELAKFPTSILITIIIFAVFTAIAVIRNKAYSKSIQE